MVFGLSTLWEGLHYGQGRKCDSQLPRPPSRWSHPSGEPVIIIFVIMIIIIIIFRIIIVICSGPSSTLSLITSSKSSFYRPPRLLLLLDSPSLGHSSPSWSDLSVKVLNCEGDSISDCLHELLSKHVLDPVWIVRPCRNTKIIASYY